MTADRWIGVGLLILAAVSYILGRAFEKADEALAVIDVPDDETPIPLTPLEQQVEDVLQRCAPPEREQPCGCRIAECQLHEQAREALRERIIGSRSRIADLLAQWSPADDEAVSKLLDGAE